MAALFYASLLILFLQNIHEHGYCFDYKLHDYQRFFHLPVF